MRRGRVSASVAGMVSADGIRDEVSLRAWLEGRPREDVLRIAVRAHSRIVPTRRFGRKGSPGGATDPLDLRFILRSWVEVSKAKPTDAHAVRADPRQINVACDAVRNTARNPYDFGNNFAPSSVVASGQIWGQVPADALAWEKGEDPLTTPLWPLSEPEWFRVANAEMRARWRDQFPELSGFWLRWWDGVVSGRQIDWVLQEKVALIPDAIWDQGPAAVAAEIARIEAEIGFASPDRTDLGQALSALPAGRATDVAQVRRAFAAHRAELPPTFDAVLGLITLEVERLQARNYRDADDAAEAKRQIGVLTTLYQAVEALKALVPGKAAMSDDDAEKAEKLARLFVRKFKEWPRANADELVDKVCRFGLVGATTAMLPMIGVTAPYAVAAGLVLFGGIGFADAVEIAIGAHKS